MALHWRRLIGAHCNFKICTEHSVFILSKARKRAKIAFGSVIEPMSTFYSSSILLGVYMSMYQVLYEALTGVSAEGLEVVRVCIKCI